MKFSFQIVVHKTRGRDTHEEASIKAGNGLSPHYKDPMRAGGRQSLH